MNKREVRPDIWNKGFIQDAEGPLHAGFGADCLMGGESPYGVALVAAIWWPTGE